MDVIKKISAEELRTFEMPRLKETEGQIRRELLNIRMDIYTAKHQFTGKIRSLKKNLARVKTVQVQRARKELLSKKG